MGRIIKIVFYSMILTICCLSPIQAEEIPYLLTASAKGDIETVKAIIGSGEILIHQTKITLLHLCMPQEKIRSR